MVKIYAVALMFVTDLWLLALLDWSIVESPDSKLIADGRAWRVDGRAQALVGPGLATPLLILYYSVRIRIRQSNKDVGMCMHFYDLAYD